MYLRPVHAETSHVVLQQLIRENPLGILTTAIPSPGHPLIQVSHVPWVLDVPLPSFALGEGESTAHLGVLRGHLARANPQAKVLIEAAKRSANGEAIESEVLVLFHGPAHSYVTPKFYTETKPETGKVVPTWNYAAAQAYGKLIVHHDSSSQEASEFLAAQISDLSEQQEKAMGFENPWKVSDAPEKYVSLLKKAIIGIEIRLERLEGKFKMSQEMPAGDVEGVVEGFEKLQTDSGKAMAELIRSRQNRV
ncbi:negative transcriptional regulator [Violaceomyces palustris]|uniref:Negative transcriptional regulator n=1 Tax=Violaceomyces palustris TaxID=1673888 RepID=A0ACD0NQN1_9BASI|nr:negative transcriptional regulator [Violaceomyces palustris]